jgi:hypothetical protein
MGGLLEGIGLFVMAYLAAHLVIELATRRVMRLGSNHLPGPRPPAPLVDEAPEESSFASDHPGRNRLGT